MATSRLFITDNGTVLCSRHLGVTAALTGRDISGRQIMQAPEGAALRCESCEDGHRRVPLRAA